MFTDPADLKTNHFDPAAEELIQLISESQECLEFLKSTDLPDDINNESSKPSKSKMSVIHISDEHNLKQKPTPSKKGFQMVKRKMRNSILFIIFFRTATKRSSRCFRVKQIKICYPASERVKI